MLKSGVTSDNIRNNESYNEADIPLYIKQAMLCSLLHIDTRKCEIFKALNLSFSTVWRIILSEQKLNNVPKLTSFIELYDLMHSLLDLVPCPLRDCLPIAFARSVSILSEVSRSALQGIKANLLKNTF